MRPVNLIPPERRRGDRNAARTGVIPYVLLAGVGLAVVAVSLVTLTGKQVADREARVASLEAEVAATEAQAQAVAPYAEFASLEAARTATVTGLAQSRFDWERVLRELALVNPTDVWLTSLAASTSAAEGEAEGAGAGIVGPSLTISGCGEGHEAVAGFVGALEDLDGVTRVGIQSSQKGGGAAERGGEEEGGAGCGELAQTASFNATVAFDNVVTGVVAGDPSAAPVPTDPTGVAATQAATQEAADSAKSQSEKATKAANLVPGVAR